MNFRALVEIVGAEPLFESSLLLAGDVDPAYIQQQLTRWVATGRVLQLRRGLYALAPPWRRVEPHPFLVSNRLVRGSYVSGEAALSSYGLIPDASQEVTAVSPARPGVWDSELGRYRFRHLTRHLLWGYRAVQVAPSQQAMVATPEKALLDLVHLTPGGDTGPFLEALRLQNLDVIDPATLLRDAERAASPKLIRAARRIVEVPK